MTQAYQIDPARCDGVLSVEEASLMQGSENLVAEEKKDDLRYLFQIAPNGAPHNFLTSRRVSVVTNEFVEKQDKVPVMRDYKFPADWAGTVFDGGLFGNGISTDTQHDLVTGNVKYSVWDVIKIGGEDVTYLPFRERRKILEDWSAFFPEWLILVDQSTDISGHLKSILDKGGEGIVIKDLNAIYGKKWTKVKEEILYDVVIIGYENSTADKYADKGWIKSVRIGQYVKHPVGTQVSGNVVKIDSPLSNGNYLYTLIDCGRSSGMTEEVRADISANQDKYLHQVMEVEAQLQFPSGKFRHPRFIRFRHDKNYWECCLEETLADPMIKPDSKGVNNEQRKFKRVR